MNNFNDFINNWKELMHAKIGLEFEFFSNYDYVKTLEILNINYSPIEVYGFNNYHSDFEVTNTKFKIEPDFSGGSNMIELITGPLEYNEAKIIITKTLEFIKKHGYTTDNSSIHINISFDDINVGNIKPVKLILNINEDFIYSKFPDRINNIYARSIKHIIPFETYIDIEYGINTIIQSFKLPENAKYYGINFTKQEQNYLEYRYIGGAKYENKKIEIFSILDYFILQTRKAIQDDYIQDDYIKLSNYLTENINWYKKYATYEQFLMNIYNIDIEVDKNTDFEDITINWIKFKDKIFELIKYTDNLSKCKINYNTFSKRIEIIDANIDSLQFITNVDFINCRINNSNIYSCDIIESEFINSHIYNSNIYDSKINTSKLNNIKATEYSELTDCIFDGGILDCIMNGGIYRSGQITSNADLDQNVKMANTSEFWMISNVTNKKDILKK